jgi:hypothetical protein
MFGLHFTLHFHPRDEVVFLFLKKNHATGLHQRGNGPQVLPRGLESATPPSDGLHRRRVHGQADPAADRAGPAARAGPDFMSRHFG